MTTMIEVKTADLIGPALDWAVAKADGHDPLVVPTGRDEYSVCVILAMDDGPKGFACRYSIDWGQGGPLIEKYGCELHCIAAANCWEANCWDDDLPTPDLHLHEAETPLIAACRAIVAAKLGDVVQVPAELVGGA